MENTDHQQPIDKISGTLEPERNGSKTKQPHRGVQPNGLNIYMSNQYENSQTPLPAASITIRRKGPVATSTKQIAGYFTVSGIENELSISENMWPCFALKELSDNACDWLNDYYPSSSRSVSSNSRANKRYLAIRIQIDKIPNDTNITRIFRIARFRPRNKVIDSKGREIYDWNAVRKGFTSSIKSHKGIMA